jgi:hypothetical protein
MFCLAFCNQQPGCRVRRRAMPVFYVQNMYHGRWGSTANPLPPYLYLLLAIMHRANASEESCARFVELERAAGVYSGSVIVT